jgi:methyltransferase (TIGR00027 family)
MWRLLRGRTAFFDRVVVNAMQRDVSQVVSVGAGYDGRALRYAKPGVRWWEVDRPDTQADKRSRLERLAISTAHISFVPLDLGAGGLATALLAAGYEPDAPGVVLCEGVAVYLETNVLEAMLHDLRSLATVGTRLAISLRPRIDSREGSTRRAAFEAAVAVAGEPALNYLTADEATHLFSTVRWRPTEISERAQQAGFVVAAPV